MPSATRQSETQLELLGDPRSEQFEQLYLASRSRVYNLAARVVRNPEDAADITQEVFLRAYVSHPAVSEWENPEPWLYKVTMNACFDHLRRRKTRPTTPLEDAGEIVAQGDGFAASELTHAIETALGKLSVRYRTAILLRDLYGLETGEISAALGVSSATTRVLLHRARRAFRKSLEHTAPGASTTLSALGIAAVLPELVVPAGLSAPALSATVAASGAPALAPLAVGGLAAKIGALLSVKTAATVTAAVVLTGGGAVAYMATHSQPSAPAKPDGSALTAAPSANVLLPPAERAGDGPGQPRRAAGETSLHESTGRQSRASGAASQQDGAQQTAQTTQAGGASGAGGSGSTLHDHAGAGTQTGTGAHTAVETGTALGRAVN